MLLLFSLEVGSVFIAHEFAHALADIAVHEAQYNKDNKEISGLQRTVNWAVNAFYDAVNGIGTAKQSLTRYAMSQEIFAVGIEMAVQRIMLYSRFFISSYSRPGRTRGHRGG